MPERGALREGAGVAIVTARGYIHRARNLIVGRIRRGGYFFITWKGDHSPRHVHVYRDGRLVVKWNLEAEVPMKGRATRRILKLIDELRQEGLL